MTNTQLEETITMIEFLIEKVPETKRKAELTLIYLNFRLE